MATAVKAADSASTDAKNRILSAYELRSAASRAMYERAARTLAGGTTGNLRHFPPYPLYFREGRGAEMRDLDGRWLIDCFLCNGPLLLGHAHEDIRSAVAAAQEAGSLLVNPPLAVEAAEELKSIVPCAERVRFLNSGTEAVMTAARLARAFTGRPKIVKFLGHYHGQDDQFLFGLDPSGAALGAGVPNEASVNTVLLPYGDLRQLDATLAGDTAIAAVLLDPAMHSGGLWGSDAAYLRALRELTRARGVVLIFDEVITGFRLALGGAQAHYGVTPDLATYAKALGAGEKLAAVAGREDIMRALDPRRPADVPAVFQSGTGNDGSVALAAAVAALRCYRRLDANGQYARLAEDSRRLAQGIAERFRARSLPCHVNQLGPMLQLFFADGPANFERFSSLDSTPVTFFYLALINEGVLLSLPTSNHIYLSFAHDRAYCARILEAVDKVLDCYDFGAIIASARKT